MFNRVFSKNLAVVICVLTLSACATTVEPAVQSTPLDRELRPLMQEATPDLSSKQRISQTRQLLSEGRHNRDQAHAELNAVLLDDTINHKQRAKALDFWDQLFLEPEQYFSTYTASYDGSMRSHKLRPGESLGDVAKLYLGSPDRFYILARLNNIDVPNSISMSSSILVPGGIVDPESVREKVAVAAPAKEAEIAEEEVVEEPPIEEETKIVEQREPTVEEKLQAMLDAPQSKRRNKQVRGLIQQQLILAEDAGDNIQQARWMAELGKFEEGLSPSDDGLYEVVQIYSKSLEFDPNNAQAIAGRKRVMADLRGPAKGWERNGINLVDADKCSEGTPLLKKAIFVLGEKASLAKLRLNQCNGVSYGLLGVD